MDFWVYGIERHFQQYFSYIVVVNFISAGNRSTQRKPPTFYPKLIFILIKQHDAFIYIVPWIFHMFRTTKIVRPVLYVRDGILLTRGKHLHDFIISLSENVWVHKTICTPFCIEVSVCVLGVTVINFCLFLRFFFSDRFLFCYVFFLFVFFSF